MRGMHEAVPKVPELANRVLNRYSKKRLRREADKYIYSFYRSPEDDEFWAQFRSDRFMPLDKLKDLSRWKTGGRQQANIEKNSNEAIKAVTRAAIEAETAVPTEPALPVGILTTLHGVDLPTASTVMTVWAPERFAILDIRVWRALRRAAPRDFRPIESARGNRRPFRLREADLYLRLTRRMREQTSLRCRTIDQALWVLGGTE